MITYNLLHVILLHVMTILLHTALNGTKSRNQVLALKTHFSVGADRSQPPSEAPCSSYQITLASLLTEGSRTAGHCVECLCTLTLSSVGVLILSIDTEEYISTVLLNYSIL